MRLKQAVYIGVDEDDLRSICKSGCRRGKRCHCAEEKMAEEEDQRGRDGWYAIIGR